LAVVTGDLKVSDSSQSPLTAEYLV
jgi:hypothetical protein